MKITILEDEKLLGGKLSIKLKRKGFKVEIFSSCKSFKDMYNYNSDIYILDIGLPDGSGLDIVKRLRDQKKSNSPIIITSGYANHNTKISALNMGVDDYLVKPYLPEELIARIRSLIRRSYKITENQIIKYKNIEYNTNENQISINGEKVELTATELGLSSYMIYNKGKLITKSELINSVWGEDVSKISDNNINVTISKIRKKLGDNFKLKTIINAGYILEK